MAKAPAFQFYVRDWLSDPELRQASLVSRGVWIDVLCYMWMMPDSDGTLKVTPRSLARLCCGGDIFEALHFLNDIWDVNFGELEFEEKIEFPITEENSDTKITIINRRMHNDCLVRKGGRERQARYREKGGGDPDKWTSIRIKILNRDESMCAYCGRKADTVDHVIPKSKGGDESDKNLVACCKRCNMKKGNRTLKDAGMSFWKGYKRLKHQNNTNSNIKITPPSSSSTSSSTSKNTQNPSFYKTNIFSRQPKNRHFEHQVGEYFDAIKTSCKNILKLPAKNGRPFNPFEFVQEKVNKARHPGAISESLEGLIVSWDGIDNPYGYANAILKTKNGNWIEKDNIIKSKEKWLVIKEIMAETFKGFEVGSDKGV